MIPSVIAKTRPVRSSLMRGTDKDGRHWVKTPEERLPKRHSICHAVLGLNYLDGMSKSAADGDTS